MLLSLCASLEGREEAEGKSISPLGAEREAFRDVFGLRWAKRRQLPLSVGEGRIAYTLYVYSILLLSPCAFLEGRKRRGRRVINISSGSGTGDFEGMHRIEVG